MENKKPVFGKFIKVWANFITFAEGGEDEIKITKIEEDITHDDVAVVEFTVSYFLKTSDSIINSDCGTEYYTCEFEKSKNHKAIRLVITTYAQGHTDSFATLLRETPTIEELLSLLTLSVLDLPTRGFKPEERVIEIESWETQIIADIFVVDEDIAQEIMDELEDAEDPDGDIAINDIEGNGGTPWAWFVDSRKLSETVRERLELFFKYGDGLKKLLSI